MHTSLKLHEQTEMTHTNFPDMLHAPMLPDEVPVYVRPSRVAQLSYQAFHLRNDP